jgi:HEAT repeat protein
MSKNVQYLSENQLRVMPYLLSNSCVARAAEEARVSPKQVYRWLQESKPFRDELRSRQMAVADAAMSNLLSHIQKAVDTLVGLLDSDKPTVRRAAARDLLDMALKLKAVDDLEKRLEQLEELAEV